MASKRILQKSSARELAAEIGGALAGGRAGMRLRPLRDLAARLGADFGRVQTAVNLLAEQGVVARRHGSGNYLRRVPRPDETSSPRLRPSDVLLSPDDESSRRRPLRSHRAMSFCVWSDPYWKSRMFDGVLGGIREVMREEGHRVAVVSGLAAPGQPLPRADIGKKLSRSPRDGHLVLDWLAGAFREPLDGASHPWIAFGFAGPVRHEPTMLMDSREAVGRAVGEMFSAGCRRVALLGYSDGRRDCAVERFHYEHALESAGASHWRRAEFVTPDPAAVRAALGRILDGRQRPDGLYVADENLQPLVAGELRARGIVPGRDLATVTLWHDGLAFPGAPWSRMEASPRQFGRSLARALLALAESGSARACSTAQFASWKPETTHRPQNGC